MSEQIKDSGKEHRTFATGAKRDNVDGKGSPILVSPLFETELWKHLEAGAKKYAARNWEQGLPLCSILDSLLRHIHAERMGDTSENHLGAMACNVMFYIHTKRAIEQGILPKELDDMPKYKKQEQETVGPRCPHCNTVVVLCAGEADTIWQCSTCNCGYSRGFFK